MYETDYSDEINTLYIVGDFYEGDMFHLRAKFME